MRLSLADVKKRVVRRKGEVYLVPTLLRRDDLLPEITALIALHESLLGSQREDFPLDRPAEVVGDYRLARALMAVLGEYYVWVPVPWPATASAEEAQALAEHTIASPSQLRLALYDAVNARHGGFLAAAERESALDAFAESLTISRSTLNTLLSLDADNRACLTRDVPAAPTAPEVAVRHNQRAVEALLNNASSVEWLLPPAFAAAQGASLGTVLKRMCFLARRTGVLYEVSFADPAVEEEAEPGAASVVAYNAPGVSPVLARVAEPLTAYVTGSASARPLDSADRPLRVTLYGPQEVFGLPGQYGDRLARLCRAWLGYHRHAQSATPAVRARRSAGQIGSGLCGTAFVALHGTTMRFTLDEALLSLLEDLSTAGETQFARLSSDPAFDSLLESRLYEEFSALARAGQSFGWSIEREPEPLLAADTILIADFALIRGGQRVYLEVAGFWTPAYRERKRRKLTALAGHAPLIVAAPDDARPELSGLDNVLPILWFKRGRVSAHELLMLLRSRFEDVALRRAEMPLAEVVATVERRGLVPWDACGELLGAFGGSEISLLASDVVEAAHELGRPPLMLVEGVGLITADCLERIRGALAVWVAEAEPDTGDGTSPRLALSEVHRRLQSAVPGLEIAPMPETWLEGLVWALGFAVVRASLFEPYVVACANPGQQPSTTPTSVARAQPRRPARRTQHVNAKTSTSAPHVLWDAPNTIE